MIRWAILLVLAGVRYLYNPRSTAPQTEATTQPERDVVQQMLVAATPTPEEEVPEEEEKQAAQGPQEDLEET